MLYIKIDFKMWKWIGIYFETDREKCIDNKAKVIISKSNKWIFKIEAGVKIRNERKKDCGMRINK